MQYPFLLRQVSRTAEQTEHKLLTSKEINKTIVRNLAIPYKSVLLAPGTPSRRSKIKFPLFFATSPLGRFATECPKVSY